MDYREINNLIEKYIRERNNPNATDKESRKALIKTYEALSVTKQSKKMKKYTVFVAYSLEGNNYTEKPNLKSTHKLFNTPEEAIEAIKNEVEQEYHNKDYRGFELKLPEIKRDEKTGNCWIYAGCFKCAYTFGPMVHYDIYINSIHMD